MSDLKQLCIDLEHFETPAWAAKAILKREAVVGVVLDPCCGTGVLAETAHRQGHITYAIDIHKWGYAAQARTENFLETMGFYAPDEFTVFMNPPFSKACQFVEKAFEVGARKVICFQRFAWWESKKRRAFWEYYPPNRVYICGDRAHCWRHDIPESERGSSTPTAHAWFVWDQAEPRNGTILGHILRDDV